MSEITASDKKKNGNRLIKKSTRVDLTPMVDLGFLLITFFVFTTTMSTATAMGMVTPNNKDTSQTDLVCASCVITVLPAANNKIYYYEGLEKNADYKITDYSAAGLRTLLMKKKTAAKAINKDAILIIKPGTTSTFKNLINIIDESNICMYKRYYLDKPNRDDEKIFNQQQ